MSTGRKNPSPSRRNRDLAEEPLWLVLEGDWGGQVYLTCPVGLMGARPRVEKLLRELDLAVWGKPEAHNGSDRAVPCYVTERELVDGCVFGGMGGGKVRPGSVWLHREFPRKEWMPRIRELLDLGPDAC